jgi:hypothetical protein
MSDTYTPVAGCDCYRCTAPRVSLVKRGGKHRAQVTA